MSMARKEGVKACTRIFTGRKLPGFRKMREEEKKMFLLLKNQLLERKEKTYF